MLEYTPSALLLRHLDLVWNCTICCPGSPAYWPQILGLLTIHDQVSQFLMINIYLSILSVLFLWRTLTNTGRQGKFIMEKWGWHHLQPPISLSISKIEKQQITCTLKSDVTGNARHYSVSLYFSGGRHGKTDSSTSHLFGKLSQETPLVEWHRNKKVVKSIKSVLSSGHCGRLELIFSRELWTWTSEFWTLNLSFRVYHLRELGQLYNSLQSLLKDYSQGVVILWYVWIAVHLNREDTNPKENSYEKRWPYIHRWKSK